MAGMRHAELKRPLAVQRQAPDEKVEIQAARQRWREARLAMFERMCPTIYRETDPLRLAPPADEVLAAPFPDDGKGFLFTGPAGTGKTRTAWMLVRRWMVARDFHVLAMNGVEYARQMGESYADGGAEAWHRRIEEVGLLFIDDVFKARMTPALADAIYSMLEARMAWRRPTILTMNAVGRSIREALPPDLQAPVERRLLESFNVYEFATRPG